MKCTYSRTHTSFNISLCVSLILLTACQRNVQDKVNFPALATFEIEPGFKIELVAAEPLISDPVAMEIDEDGNMYVVENHGYPLDKNGTGKIKLLKDTNGDGVMDTSILFAEGLTLPTGVMRWKQGIIVTDAPDVLYLEDSTGDGKADIKRTMLTGFALSNPQHNVNNPMLGIDNWIYLAHERAVGTEVYKKEFGDVGGDIYYPDMPEGGKLRNNADGRNVRFRPDQHALELLSSTTQFGHTFDTWGHHLLVNNANHLMHSVIAAPYLQRNPRLIVSSTTRYLPDHGNAAEVFPITKNPEHQLLTDVGVMTSACAITYYSGGAFPTEFNTDATFVAEPVSNIVHADKLKSDGSSFIASRIDENREFLASTDAWFRPVNMYIGPDGALYVVDYYREIIEHPEWLSEEVINSGKLYNGKDMGRIYRISRTEDKPATWTKDLKLGGSPDEELVAMLADPNIWWRRNAQRLLLDRKNDSVTPHLIQMTKNVNSPVGRLHALWTLEGLNQLSPEIIINSLSDPEPGIRENAIKLAELHMGSDPEIVKALVLLQDDDVAKVRFQLLCTLGFIDSPEVAQIRHKLLLNDIDDEFVSTAALSAPTSHQEGLLELVLARFRADIPAYASLVQSLTVMTTLAGQRKSTEALLRKAITPTSDKDVAWQAAVLKGLATGFKNRHTTISESEENLLVGAFFEHPSLPVRQGCLQVLQASKVSDGKHIKSGIQKAIEISTNEKLPERNRALSISFLALQNPAAQVSLLKNLILLTEPLAVELAALRTMNAIPDQTVCQFALEHWETLSPPLQDAALNTFMENDNRVNLLIESIESGKIMKASIGWSRSVRLMTQQNVVLRDRARTLLAKNDGREKVVKDYQTALDLHGDLERGKLVYEKNCALCHQVKGELGIPFGPDLGTVQSWPASGIMTNILDPYQSIADSYDLWTIVLKNGETLQGVITTETPSSLTLRNVSGIVTTISRQEVKNQKAMHMSAMPDELEKQITHQEMADLLAFLQQTK